MSTSVRGSRLRYLLLAALFALALAAPNAAAARATVVTLTFDDGLADQYVVRTALAQRSLRATFFVNSNRIDTDASYLTWSQLSNLAADGNEIGGHTLDHVDLTTVSASEAQRQVCDDRQALVSRGHAVTSFAYPFGARNSSLYSIIQGCGYTSARRSWGLCALGQAASTCSEPLAEAIPPSNRWEVRTIPSVRTWHTLADLQAMVARAEQGGGGWVPIILHHVCDGCDPSGYSISPSLLSAFLDWLAPRSSGGTYVRTVRDVTSDTTAPASSIACNGSSCSSTAYASPVSVSLSATDAGSGVDAIRYTVDGSDPTAASQLYTGPFTVSTTTTVKYRASDAAGNVEATKSRLIEINTAPVDTTPPVTTIACNGSSCSSTAYAAPVSVSLSATDAGSGVDAIRYTVDGSDPTAASQLYTGPFTVSTTSTVKYRAWDAAGNVEATKSRLIEINTAPVDTTAPVTTIACNGAVCSAGWYAASVSVSLTATDAGSGVDVIRYTLDGSDPTPSSQAYGGPFTVSTTATVKYRAWDTAGNVEATKSQAIQVDSVAPTIAITSPANGATVAGNIKIVASPADAGSGVASVAFYLDGTLLGTVTSSPWQLPWNTKKSGKGQHVLTAVATDRAGNTQTSASVTVTVR